MRLLLPLVLAGCEPWTVHLSTDPASLPVVTAVPSPDPVLVAARVVPGTVRTCAAPQLRRQLGPFDRRIAAAPPDSVAWLGGGVLAGDLDGDGHLDLVAPLEPYTSLFRGGPEAQMAVWDGRLAGFDLSNGAGGSVADYDGDGDLDVLVLRTDRPAVLLRNDGPGLFADASSDLPVPVDGPTTSSAWGDMDADGDLDLFIGSYGELSDVEATRARSYLFENAGDGVFFDRSARLPEILHQGFTRVGGFHDLDADGYPELYVVNDVGSVAPNILLRNVNGTFVEDGHASGLDLPMSGGGLGVGDINGDGLPDFLIPQWDELSLMLSGSAGHWVDWALALGLEPANNQRVGWGAELADIDNDGDLDGIVAYGHLDAGGAAAGWENRERQPDALFLQLPDGTFIDEAVEWGVADEGRSRGIVVADFNEDGWLDMAKRDLGGPSVLYVSRCGEAHWLVIRLLDEALPNRFAVGARVRVVSSDGSVHTRWLSAGGTGYGTGGPPEVHVGLGFADSVSRIEVLWPDGTLSHVGFGLDADQTVTIVRE